MEIQKAVEPTSMNSLLRSTNSIILHIALRVGYSITLYVSIRLIRRQPVSTLSAKKKMKELIQADINGLNKLREP